MFKAIGVVLKYRNKTLASEPAHLALYLFCSCVAPGVCGKNLASALYAANGQFAGLLLVYFGWQFTCVVLFESFLVLAKKAVPDNDVAALMFTYQLMDELISALVFMFIVPFSTSFYVLLLLVRSRAFVCTSSVA